MEKPLHIVRSRRSIKFGEELVIELSDGSRFCEEDLDHEKLHARAIAWCEERGVKASQD